MNHIVETKYGKVEGFEENSLVKYLGIPFAEQPVGALVWERCRECKPWDGVLEAKAYGPVALQDDKGIFQGSNECLTINVVCPETENFLAFPSVSSNSRRILKPLGGRFFFKKSSPPFILFKLK